MSGDQLVILVTGSIGNGKTTFLERLERACRRWWRVCGFTSPASSRPTGPDRPASRYDISLTGRPVPLPWAARGAGDAAFEFSENTRQEVTEAVSAQLDGGDQDICILDEIGRLELAGGGFAELFRHALAARCGTVVAAVKKACLAEVVGAFRLEGATVIDLDHTDPAAALRDVRRRIAARDAERIGAFAGIGGMVEVGLGSSLHAYRVPFKGHALAYLQNALLIAFGKALRGRGLVRISFISAMLKAFSPVGNRFRPMAYIFLQGLAFSAPVRLLGWHVGAVAAGSILMAWLTLALSLGVDYVTFGRSIFDAYGGAIATVSGWLGTRGPSLAQVIAGAFALKALIALALATTAFYGDLQPLVHRLGRRRARPAPTTPAPAGARHRRRPATLAALRDLVRPRFVIAFLVSVMLLLFFAGLSRDDAAIIVVRGLCISYLGFLAMRRLDLHALGGWLDRRAGLGLGQSLPVALEMLGRLGHHHPPAGTTPDETSTDAAQAEAGPAGATPTTP